LAIYSCNLASIGRVTHAAGTAGAHVRYIGRERAASEVMAEHMPDDARQARTWMDQHEAQARKNARVCDKIRIALPRELDEKQRAELVRDTMRDLTGGRVPWYAAIHQTGRDAHNPHAHIAVVDKDIETGKRVLRLSDSERDRRRAGLEPKAVQWVRKTWEDRANAALEGAGHQARIDRRSLEARGEDRTPQIHIGPQAQHIDRSVHRPDSKPVSDPTPKHPERVIDYPAIDAGRTRRERCAEIVDLNLERAARSQDFQTRVRAGFEREQRNHDAVVEREIVAAARQRTLEDRRLRQQYRARIDEIRQRERAEGKLARDWTKQRHTADTQALRQRQAAERADLKNQQARPFARFFAAVDVTGRTKAKREAARKALAEKHKRESHEQAQAIRAERTTQAKAVKGRYKPDYDEVRRQYRAAWQEMRARHADQERQEESRLQARATEREQAWCQLEDQIRAWQRMQKQERGQQQNEKVQGTGRLREDWEGKDRKHERSTGDERTPEQRGEDARRRMEEGEEKRRQKRGRSRRRDPD